MWNTEEFIASMCAIVDEHLVQMGTLGDNQKSDITSH
jgi:hypothetical protein